MKHVRLIGRKPELAQSNIISEKLQALQQTLAILSTIYFNKHGNNL